MAEAVRISEPRMYQASSSRHEGADRAQQALGQSDLAGTAAQAGGTERSRHGTTADSVTKHWHSRNAGRVIEADRNTGRLGRTARRQRLPPSALSKDPSITTKQRRSPISRRTIRHSAEIRPSSRNRSSIQW